jgi:hypothetical protein
VGVDLGDQGSHYFILGLAGETLAEGQLRTQPLMTSCTQAECVPTSTTARAAFNPWKKLAKSSCVEHEVLVANPRLMDGSKRRKRKNDRIDAIN